MERNLMIFGFFLMVSLLQAQVGEVHSAAFTPKPAVLPLINKWDAGALDSLLKPATEEEEQSTLSILNEAFDYYQGIDDQERAYYYGEKLISFKEYISGQQLRRKLASLEKEFEMDQKELEIQLLNTQRILNEERIKAGKRRQWIIMGGILVLLAFALALWNRVRTIRKIRDLMQAKATQLQYEKNRAEKSEKFKEQFLANVSHEIRTPMNAILGITNILIKNRHLGNQEKYLAAMHDSAKNLLVLINDILDLSKLEAGKVELVQTPFSPAKILGELRDKMGDQAAAKGLALHVEIPRDVPKTLNGDGYVLSNILMTLTSNAISFTESGRVDVVCSASDRSGEEVILKVMVKDTGIGIVPEKQDKILDTFVKVHEKSSLQYRGSGLELPIIKQLINLQGGTIRLESAPGKGTAFFIDIPYRILTNHSTPEVSSVTPEDCELSDIHVLLVEDNEFNVMVASTELESVIGGLKLDVAENGQVALEMVHQNDYHLILMDVQMPVMDGYEATRQIRKLEGRPGEIPIIAMSANVLQQEIEKCLKEGMNDYISKPFDMKELLGKMKNLLRPVH